jgi:hypothetical protein
LIHRLFICICLIFAGFFGTLKAQYDELFFNEISKKIGTNSQIALNKSRLLIGNQNYVTANKYIDTILQAHPKNERLNFLMGLCCAYNPSTQQQSISYIKLAESINASIPHYYYYLAYAYEVNDSLNAAATNYKLALEKDKQSKFADKYYQEEINIKIRQVENQIAYKNKKSFVTVKNLGAPVNTKASEYVPLMPSDESELIYTYRGELSKGGKQILNKKQNGDKKKNEQGLFFEDIFITHPIGDSAWQTPTPIDGLNTNLHDAAVSISADGTQLFIYKNTGSGGGDLFLSKLDGKRWMPGVYQNGLNSKEWDGSACFLPDNKRAIISSERKGGFGGRDLYIAERLANNKWGNIKNLGPLINSKYDEDAPFVTADGKILFFASNGKKSIGGYDVMRSDWKDTSWTEPYNLGEPINTKYDDKFFISSASGKRAFYSTQRPDGFGEQDIYVIEPGIPGKPVALVQVGGIVTVNNKPAEAEIEVRSLTKRNVFVAQLSSNKITGKFIINVPSGDEYEVIFNHKKFPPQVKELSTTAVDSFMTINMIADFYTPEVNEKLELKRDSMIASNTVVNKKTDLEEFVSRFGFNKVEGLTFKVQVGAFKFFENFNYTSVLGFPKILRQTGNDGITRFTMGGYETVNEAKELLDRVRSKSLKEAFIIAIYNDKRYYLQDLVKEGIVK